MGCTRFDLTVSVDFRYWSHSQFLHNREKRDLSGYKLHQPFLLHSRCSHLLKRQQFISIIFILLLSCFNLCGQANIEVGANLFKVVQHINNAALDIKWRDCHSILCNRVSSQGRSCCKSTVFRHILSKVRCAKTISTVFGQKLFGF